MKRLDNWRSRLSAELDRQRLTPFEWGGHDCALGFAGGIVEALTGEDMAAPYRGTYRSLRSAKAVLRDAGAADLGDFVATLLPEIDPAQARIGDLGIIETPDAFGQGLCMVDASTLLVLTNNGHGHKPRSAMIRAFRVGE
ncbi:DUF6950 family protein [Paracoccus homiensis]|uniref:DUF6950 domain-containing protein n=1 Tax=Paracoccus homiensis TaxID=364199 RepID=A0A1I0J0X1_9RHOB|nr:hypothetical protein [Paracoccus homiensis]SEU03385.1 hypothetical protein SAMN04489858_12068 [Paracoccus homiensis]